MNLRVIVFCSLVAPGRALDAAPPAGYLEFPYVDVKPTIQDSGIVVERGKKAYWIDNETLVFSAPTSETWEHWQPVRQVPVIRITSWNTNTGSVQRFGEVHYNDFCASNGRILYRTYRMDGTTRVRDKGKYRIDAWWGGPLNAATYLGDEMSADLQRHGYDEVDCSPRSQIPPIPKWLATKGWWHNHLSKEFGVKIDSTRDARSRSEPPLLCSYESRSEQDCKVLELPTGHGYSYRYVNHLSAFIFTSKGSIGQPHLILGLVRMDGQVNRYAVTDTFNRTGTARIPLVTRVGALFINNSYPNRMNDSDVGIWQARGQDLFRIGRAYVQQLGTTEASVSPDGCKLAVTGNKHGGDARTTLMSVRLC